MLAVLGIFVWLVGLAIGSFLNVVIYRVPRGLSIATPRRSFCPNCHSSIKWFDNVPIIGWLRLGGRCRDCHAPIAVQYPVVEAATGLAFALTFFLLFVADTAPSAEHQAAWPADAPLLLAWLVLVAAMIVCSATDLTLYIIDVNVTNFAVAAGLLLHLCWPGSPHFETTATSPWAAAGLAAALTSILTLAITTWRPTTPEPEASPSPEETSPPESRRIRRLGLVAALLVALLGLGLATAGPLLQPENLWNWAIITAFAALFLIIETIGAHERESDEQVRQEIEEEAPQARRTALAELAWLAPSIAAGVLTYFLVARFFLPGWESLATWPITSAWAPLGGLAFAATGFVIAAAAGWALRIVFTLIFGREAFGTGDIYILAAAGACIGARLALLGLLLSIGFAILGWLISLLIKRSVMIPLGPWLGLGFLAALWLQRPLMGLIGQYISRVRETVALDPQMAWILGGFVLVAFAVSIVLARLVRNLVEPEESA